MAMTVQFELVSPERLLVSEAVEMVVVPGTEGNFGVLPEHSPLLSTIRPGVIDIYNKGEITNRIFVAGGFADVNETSCTVLAEEAIPVRDLTADMCAVRIQAQEDARSEANNPVEREAAIRRLAVAKAMQEAFLAGV